MINKTILIIEDELKERNRLLKIIEDLGYIAISATDGQEILNKIKSTSCSLIIMNQKSPDIDGFGLMKKIYLENPDIKFVVLSSEPSVEDAVSAMKAGAIDFILKPVEIDHIKNLLKMVFDQTENENQLKNYKNKSLKLVTHNKAMRRLIELVKQVADSRASILIQGESGTGKELIARFIHENSSRKNKPFVAINCAALPETLLESELFGYEKGAFTGAISRKTGKFELANGGTVLLDEITEMQFHLQSKLLRVLQEREIDRVGGTKPIQVDVRVIATTNRDIKASIEKGDFREDLFYRLNVVPIKIPPLRDRKEDIPILTQHFVMKYNEIDNRNVKGLTDDALARLMEHPFKGNVRELENVIERSILLSDGEYIKSKDFLWDNDCEPQLEEEFNAPEGEEPSVAPLRDVEKKLIMQALGKTNGNRTHAANILGISVRTLRNKLNEYKETMKNI
ncbi:MAG: sigma-54-dependent Fis family transcriptional regulator [Desulfobacterales bacterium]|nr:sigma-54-dependent Fis family transcriptional regulator [Desulfobacterales bacterium]